MLDSGLWKIVAVAIQWVVSGYLLTLALMLMLLALLSTLLFANMASHELMMAVTVLALFFRGVGMGSISIPSMSAAYVSIPRQELPIATTAINIVQRLGGPMQRGGRTC